MSKIKTNLPQVRVSDPNLQKLLDNLALVLKTWNGETKNDLDRVITYRDLVEDTALSAQLNNALASGQEGGIDFGADVDLTTPPQLTSLIVAQGPTKNVIDWEGTYAGSYAYTEIWRHTSDDLGNATLNATTEANIYADDVGEIAQEYFYWVRGISTAGVPGPFNATAGTAQTVSAVDTAHIADAAIVEAKIGNLEVSTAKIASLAVTTAKINNLAVTTGKIANLSVDTLQIADNAVTAVLSAFTVGASTITSTGNYYAQTVSITTEGDDVFVLGGFELNVTFGAGGGTFVGKICIFRGSTIIWTGQEYTVFSASPRKIYIPAITLSNAVAAGTYSYGIGVSVSILSLDATPIVTNRFVRASEAKK